jgi:integrase
MGADSPIVSPKKVFLKDLAEEFLQWTEVYLARNTHLFYQDRLKAVFRHMSRHILITNIKGHVDPFIYVRCKEVGNATVNKELKALKRLMSFAVERGYLAQNPLAKLKYLPDNRAEKIKDRKFYTKEQMQRFLAHAPERYRALYFLLFGTGLRKDETFTLKWSNIDFERRMLTVVGKGSKLRSVPLTPLVLDVLRRHPRAEGTEYLFPGRRGGHIKDIRGTTWQVMERAGLPRITFHGMRYSFVSNLMMGGADMKTVQEAVGHSQISITYDLYGHLTKDHLERTMTMAQEMIFPVEAAPEELDECTRVVSLASVKALKREAG